MRALVHAENKELCQLGVAELEKLRDETATEEKKYTKMSNTFDQNVIYAREQLRILNHFGRFPSRNPALGRQNTKEEDMYLAG